MIRLFVAALVAGVLAAPVAAAPATNLAILNWQATTQSCEGTPETVSRYRVYWGAVGRVAAGLPPSGQGCGSLGTPITDPRVAQAYPNSVETTILTQTIELPQDNQRYYFAVIAIDAAGNASNISNEVSKLSPIPAPTCPPVCAPNPPIPLWVTFEQGPPPPPFQMLTTGRSPTAVDDANGEISWSYTVPTGANKVVVQVVLGANHLNSRRMGSVTLAGRAMTLGAQREDTHWSGASLWYLDNPPAGAASIVVRTLDYPNPAYAPDMISAATAFRGAAPGLGVAATNAGTTANPSVTVADTPAGSVVMGVYMSDVGTNGPTTVNGGTQLWEVEDFSGGDNDASVQHLTATGPNTVLRWTAVATGAWWALVGAAVKAQ